MTELNAKITGEGPGIVLLHGFCEDLTLWDELQQLLEHSYQVIAIDLPGFGKSDPMPGSFTLTDIASVVHRYLNAQNISNYSVLGHSLGGYIALEMKALFPPEVQLFGLIHSTALTDSEDKKQNRNKAIEFIRHHGVKVFLGEFVKGLFDNRFVERNKEAIAKVEAMGSNLTSATVIAYIEAMRDRNSHLDMLQSYPEQCLFLYGKDDNLFTAKDIESQTSIIPGSNVAELDNVAHMGMYEDFYNFQSHIFEFLDTENSNLNPKTN